MYLQYISESPTTGLSEVRAFQGGIDFTKHTMAIKCSSFGERPTSPMMICPSVKLCDRLT